MFKKRENLQKKYNELAKKIDSKLLKIHLKEKKGEFLFLPKIIKKNNIKIIYKDKKNSFLRKEVAEKLIKVAKIFNKKGFILSLESSYRSLDEQKRRFIKRYKEMKRKFPKKTKVELLQLSNIYTGGIPILSAHTAGAAVDVTLLNKKGKLLNFGASYRHGDIESVTEYPYLPKKIIENRKILKKGMEKYGFVNYPFEYWHYSIGDVCATYLSKKKYAKYGPVNYDFKNKKLIFPKQTKDLYSYFKVD